MNGHPIPDWGDIIADVCNEAAQAGLDAWTVRCVQSCLETARDLITKYEVEPENVLIEHRLDMTDLGMAGGTADLILVVPFRTLILVDWKFTFMDQGTAADHDQLQAYAIAGAATFKVSEVLVYLVAPRASKEMRITAASFDAAALNKNQAWTRAVVASARADNPKLTPTYNACLYCKALTLCPAARKFIMDAQEALAVIGKPTTPADLGALADAAKLAEEFADQGKTLVKAELLAGKSATGWKLGSSRTTKSVVDVPAALAELEAAGIRATDLALADAITIKVNNLPDEAEAVIAGRITDKVSSPSLTQDKASRHRAA